MEFLLDSELKILFYFTLDDFVWQFETDEEPGWKNTLSHTWIKGFHRSCEMDEYLFLSLLSGLAAKKIIGTDNQTFWLTDYGRQVLDFYLKPKGN